MRHLKPINQKANRVVDHVTASAPGLLVVRNAFDRNWRAFVDGKSVPVQVTDYLVQGVAVPAGSHVVELRYRDPWLGVGVIASATAWALLGGLFLVLRRRERMLGPPVARQGHDAVGLGSAGVAATGPEARSS